MMGETDAKGSSQDKLNKHVQGGHEEWKRKPKQVWREHPLVVQRQYGCEYKPEQ
jgi:hypothetical protein